MASCDIKVHSDDENAAQNHRSNIKFKFEYYCHHNNSTIKYADKDINSNRVVGVGSGCG